jgi:tRNA-binding protein
MSEQDSFVPAPVKAIVTIDALERLDVRVGTIESVEDVEGSDKLLKLTVSFGDQRRTILAGMKRERANPREIVG